jgi:hypothetical protein
MQEVRKDASSLRQTDFMRLLISILLLTVFACSPKTKIGALETKQTEEVIWKGLQRLLGEWYDSSQNVYEEWELNGNFNLKGEEYTKDVAGNHITSSRYKLMWAPEKAITYAATVMKDNMGKETRFVLTQADKDSYTFENPQHDFPKKIKYVIKGPDAIEATISAGEKWLTYKFIRVKPEE